MYFKRKKADRSRIKEHPKSLLSGQQPPPTMLHRSTWIPAAKEKSIELGDKQLLQNEEPTLSYKRTLALVNISTEPLKELSVTVKLVWSPLN